MNRTTRRLVFVALCAALAVAACQGSVSVGVGVPIGSPWGYGPTGMIGISSGPIYFH